MWPNVHFFFHSLFMAIRNRYIKYFIRKNDEAEMNLKYTYLYIYFGTADSLFSVRRYVARIHL